MNREQLKAVLTILKQRFPNLTAEEAASLTFDIVLAVVENTESEKASVSKNL